MTQNIFEIRVKQKSLDKEKVVFVGNQIPEFMACQMLEKYAGNPLYNIQVWQTNKDLIRKPEKNFESCDSCEFGGSCPDYEKGGTCGVYDEFYDEDGEEYE